MASDRRADPRSTQASLSCSAETVPAAPLVVVPEPELAAMAGKLAALVIETHAFPASAVVQPLAKILTALPPFLHNPVLVPPPLPGAESIQRSLLAGPSLGALGVLPAPRGSQRPGIPSEGLPQPVQVRYATSSTHVADTLNHRVVSLTSTRSCCSPPDSSTSCSATAAAAAAGVATAGAIPTRRAWPRSG